jgi:phage-related tail fiber protein
MPNLTASDVRIKQRGRTTAAWTAAAEVLLYNEIGIATDTGLIKIGDGATAWDGLPYINQRPAVIAADAPETTDNDRAIGDAWIDSVTGYLYILYDLTDGVAEWKRVVTEDDLAALGVGDMLKSDYATNAKSDEGYVDKAIVADKLSATRSVSITGDATGTTSTDFSAAASIAVTLANSGVSAGAYPKVTVNAKGLVTAGEALAASDIPDLTLAKITDAGTAAAADLGTAQGNVPVVGADGKLDSSVLPDLPDGHDTFAVADADGLVTLTTAGVGDTAITQDTGDMYRLVDTDPTVAANWKKVTNASDGVTSWAGRTGAVVPVTADVTESTNLYYTDARATSNFTANFASAVSTDLYDGSTILHTTDTIIFDCNPVV